MTYGLRPENWPAFEAELTKRNIAARDIEKLEMNTTEPGVIAVTVTLRSGRAESWRPLPTP